MRALCTGLLVPLCEPIWNDRDLITRSAMTYRMGALPHSSVTSADKVGAQTCLCLLWGVWEVHNIASQGSGKGDTPILFRRCSNLTGVSEALLDVEICSGCMRAQYCSPACQKAAWKHHKTSCKAEAARLVELKRLA